MYVCVFGHMYVYLCVWTYIYIHTILWCLYKKQERSEENKAKCSHWLDGVRCGILYFFSV